MNISEEQRIRGQEGKPISSLTTLSPCGRAKLRTDGAKRVRIVEQRGRISPQGLKARDCGAWSNFKTGQGEGSKLLHKTLSRNCKFAFCSLTNSTLSQRERVKSKNAFTLAEVLITLGIIGVVAAMTLPNFIFNYKTKVIVTKLKRNQSIMSQAFKRAIAEEGEISGWGLETDTKESVELIASKIKPYLKIIDDCGTERCESYTQEYYHIDQKTQQSQGKVKDFGSDIFYKFRLADGTEWFIRSSVAIYFDINGKKGPNSLGRDIFQFHPLVDGTAIAAGMGQDPKSHGWPYCNPDAGQGWYCAAWVIYKENMDYLKCADELEWNGKTTCK